MRRGTPLSPEHRQAIRDALRAKIPCPGSGMPPRRVVPSGKWGFAKCPRCGRGYCLTAAGRIRWH